MPAVIVYWLVVVIWSTAPLAIQFGALDTGFSFAAASRMLIAVICAIFFTRLLKIEMPTHRDAILSYLCAGGGLFGAMYCVYWAALSIPSGLMSVVFGITPFVTSVLAYFLLGESSFSFRRLAGMSFSLTGLAVVFLSDSVLVSSAMISGLVALLLGVLAHAGSIVGLKRISDHSHPLATTAGALIVASPLFVIAWLLEGAPFPQIFSSRGFWSIFYLGTFGSVLSFVLYYSVLQKMKAESVAMITVITPVLALFFGLVFNEEKLPALVWVGVLLISVGLAIHQVSTESERA